MMKEDAKKRHRSGKVNVKESARVAKKRKVINCSNCHQEGHNKTICPLPPLPKLLPKSDHVDWNVVTPIVRSKPRGKKYAADLIDWSA